MFWLITTYFFLKSFTMNCHFEQKPNSFKDTVPELTFECSYYNHLWMDFMLIPKTMFQFINVTYFPTLTKSIILFTRNEPLLSFGWKVLTVYPKQTAHRLGISRRSRDQKWMFVLHANVQSGRRLCLLQKLNSFVRFYCRSGPQWEKGKH